MIPLIQSRESLEKLVYNYIRYLEAERHASPYTVRNYTHDLRHFLEFLEMENVATLGEVDRHLLRRYIASLQEHGFEKSSVSRKLSALRSFYSYLMQQNLIDSNPLLTPRRNSIRGSPPFSPATRLHISWRYLTLRLLRDSETGRCSNSFMPPGSG